MSSKEKTLPLLAEYVDHRINKRNKNFVMLFVGSTGSGKSYSALKMGEMLDPTFNIDRVCFKAKDFMNKINSMIEESKQGNEIKGKVIMWDEFGVEHNSREFMTISNRVINYFFQTSRHLNLIVIMTVPLLSFIDSATRKLMHAIAEMKSIDTTRNKARIKVKMLQVNAISGKEYPKYLRYRRNNRTYVSKAILLSLPSKNLINEYEKKKMEFTSQLNQSIMNKLLRDEAKDVKKYKSLTDIQEKVLQLLRNNSIEQTAKLLGLSKSTVHSHKTSIENKNIHFKPIYEGNRVTGYEIKDFRPISNVNPIQTPV